MPTRTDEALERDILGRLFGNGMSDERRQRWDMACLIAATSLFPYLRGNPADPVLLLEAQTLYAIEGVDLGPVDEITELLSNVRAKGLYQYIEIEMNRSPDSQA